MITKVIQRELIAQAILEEGISPHQKGFQYILDGIQMIILNFDLVKAFSKELYPSIARKNNSSPLAVERAIRISIKKAWGLRDDKRPTNSEFITFLSYKIILNNSLSS